MNQQSLLLFLCLELFPLSLTFSLSLPLFGPIVPEKIHIFCQNRWGWVKASLVNRTFCLFWCNTAFSWLWIDEERQRVWLCRNMFLIKQECEKAGRSTFTCSIIYSGGVPHRLFQIDRYLWSCSSSVCREHCWHQGLCFLHIHIQLQYHMVINGYKTCMRQSNILCCV